jgi:Uma2 family endonuclease
MTSPIENSPAKAPKTIEDWLAQPEERRLELIDGALVEKAAPSFEHSIAQAAIVGRLQSPFHRKSGGPRGPGGWWLGTEVDIEMDGRGFRPDVAGWRRERMPEQPKTRPVRIRPDWICEVLSDSNRSTDLIKKLRRYHQAGVPHYWILDQLDRSLTVHRHGTDGYIVALRAGADEKVRAEPFDAIELSVAELFGDDDE